MRGRVRVSLGAGGMALTACFSCGLPWEAIHTAAAILSTTRSRRGDSNSMPVTSPFSSKGPSREAWKATNSRVRRHREAYNRVRGTPEGGRHYRLMSLSLALADLCELEGRQVEAAAIRREANGLRGPLEA